MNGWVITEREEDMKINKKPSEIWSEYKKVSAYLQKLDLYEIVKQNEKFFEGEQWFGLEETDLPTPVINVLQRSGLWDIASLNSNDVANSITPFSSIQDDIKRMRVVSEAVDHVIENTRTKELSRLVTRNAFVDGSCFTMQTFNPDIDTGQMAQGDIENEIVDNTNMYFGNPYSSNIQKQPWIIVALRQDKNQVLDEIKTNKKSEEDTVLDVDNDNLQVNDDSDNLVTVLIKFWKEKKEVEAEQSMPSDNGAIRNIKYKKTVDSVWFTKVTEKMVIKEPTELGYRRYPIAHMPWHYRKNSYQGISPMTNSIENQVFINKAFALGMLGGEQSTLPKTVFDKTKLDIQDIMNSQIVGTTNIDMMGKILDFIKIPDFSDKIIELAKETISQTKDSLGVTDAALGNVKPENTSAIIALQESSTVPLEIQKQYYYEYWEDTIRNILDIMANQYGKRYVMSEEFGMALVDFDLLQNLNYSLNVEIGAGAQYSQIAQINTLDKYLQSNLISGSLHAKLMPNKFLLGKNEIMNEMKQRELAMAQSNSVAEPNVNMGVETIAQTK